MSETAAMLLAELKSGMQALYAQRLCGVYLYGSYARGEAGCESDLDVLIVLDEVGSYGAEIDRTSRLISRISLKYGISVSRVFVPERQWRAGEGLFLATVREESIPA